MKSWRGRDAEVRKKGKKKAGTRGRESLREGEFGEKKVRSRGRER